MPTKNDYKPTLVLFMNYTFGEGQVIYTTESDITDNELLQITPDHVANYLKHRAHGTADPGDDAQPNLCRSSSLQYWKKALSYYMPNGLQHWNIQAGVGNPTKSKAVNDVIKNAKKAEVRKQGKPSQARRPFTKDEYSAMLRQLRSQSDDKMVSKYMVPAFCMSGSSHCHCFCFCQFNKLFFHPPFASSSFQPPLG